MVILGEDGYNLHLQFTPELANDWKNAMLASVEVPYLLQRVMTSMNASQLESKIWLVQTLKALDNKFGFNPRRVALLAGWFGQYIVPLMFDTFDNCKWIENFEIDNDVSPISYKFNKRYKDENKYKMNIRNIMTKPMRIKSNPNIAVPPEDIFDIVINCSCEHMFPMWKFREMNERFHGRPLYVLQSSNATQHEDHINCVESVDELIEQAKIKDVLFSGSKVLPNDSTRFMVIGK